jgi:hypothetical protein
MPASRLLPLLFGLVVAPLAAQQPAPPPAAATPAVMPAPLAGVTAAQFARLRWLDGTWRGRLPDGRAFYERYRVVDDSTLQMASFQDSTLATSREGDRLALRGGTVRYEDVVATRLDASGIAFVHPGGRSGFDWTRAGDGWTATLWRLDAAGRRTTTVYPMTPHRAADGAAANREAVRLAVLDYVEGFYEGDTTRLQRSVWPAVRKWGYARGQAAGAPYQGMAMAFPDGFMRFAGNVREGRARTPAGAPREITVFDVLDQTASAKLTAYWGVDYLLLARENGRWMITHVLWQTPPGRAARDTSARETSPGDARTAAPPSPGTP